MHVHVCVCLCESASYYYIPINALHFTNFTQTQTHSSSETAASVESLQCIQILQTYGANFGVKSVHGATPMHKAAASEYVGPSLCLCTFDLWIDFSL